MIDEPVHGSKEILMAEIQLFRDSNFLGGSITKTASDNNLKNAGFNDALSSVIVTSGTFTLYQDVNFGGYSFTVCKTGGPNSDGRYPNPQALAGRNDAISSLKVNSDNPL
jgi:Beta/Gamma crystallin